MRHFPSSILTMLDTQDDCDKTLERCLGSCGTLAAVQVGNILFYGRLRSLKQSTSKPRTCCSHMCAALGPDGWHTGIYWNFQSKPRCLLQVENPPTSPRIDMDEFSPKMATHPTARSLLTFKRVVGGNSRFVDASQHRNRC